MLTIGLIGGIASGKSTVARLLEEQGALVLDADRFAHLALSEPEVIDQLTARWGKQILAADGQIDRRRIAERVFGDSPEAAADRRFLEGLVHPRVRRRVQEALAERAKTGHRVAVLDVPLLLEAGWSGDCDLILFVGSDEATRLSRAAARGWDAAELAQRESAQLPIAEKQRRSDYSLANDGDLDALRQAVAEFWRREVVPRFVD